METKSQNEIVKINPADFGVEESKATQIAEQFKPMLDRMIELETEYNAVLALDIDDPMTTFAAKEVRLKYVKVRTGTSAIHKVQKDFYLQAGRFIDGWKNAQLFASQGIEEKLADIELHYENKEKARKAQLRIKRCEELNQFEFDGSGMNLGEMEENVWVNFLNGTKLGFEAKKAEEKRLAEEKTATEKAEKEERERIAEENKRLKVEAEAKEKQLADERATAKKELEKKEAIRAAEQKKADELLESQRKAAEAKAKKEKEISDAKLKAEREAKEKLEAELKAKQDAERKAEEAKQAEMQRLKQEEITKREKELALSEKGRLKKWITGIDDGVPESCLDMSAESKKIINAIQIKHIAFKKWANEQINTL